VAKKKASKKKVSKKTEVKKVGREPVTEPTPKEAETRRHLLSIQEYKQQQAAAFNKRFGKG
jgi:hypothetical protein